MSEAPILKTVYRLDSIPVDETYYTKEGFLIDHPVVTTVGIFEYIDGNGKIRRELRLPEEVFAEASLASYEGKPIIVTHSAGLVTKDNAKKETIGTILSKGYKDGDKVKAKIVIHDTDKMKASGLRELSLGYNVTLDETPGEWNGQHYDAIQRDIRINHLALVSAARAGEEARLNIDGKEILTGGPKMEENKLDGSLSPEELSEAIADYLKKKSATPAADGDSPVEAQKTADGEETPVAADAPKEDEDVVQSVKDRRDRRDAEQAPTSIEDANEVIQQQDEDIGKLLELIEQLQAKNDFNAAKSDCQLTPDGAGCVQQDCDAPVKKDGDESKSENLNLDAAQVDRIVAEKLGIIRLADQLRIDGIETLPVMEGKKKIIKSVFPNMRLDGKPTAYVDALYDLTVQEVKKRNSTDGQRRQMFNKDSAPAPQMVSGQDAARQRMIERSKNNGKQGGNK